MSSGSKTLDRPKGEEKDPVTITITESGWSIRSNDPNPETRYRPLSKKEVDRALEKAEKRHET